MNSLPLTIFSIANSCLPLFSILDFCYINGKKYNAGERFVDEQCSGSCICRGLNSFECVSLCPPEGIMCNEGEAESSVKVQVSKTPICYCSRPTCVKKSTLFIFIFLNN